MVTGENTKYHDAAAGLKGLGLAVKSFDAVRSPDAAAFALDPDAIAEIARLARTGHASGSVHLAGLAAEDADAAEKRRKEKEEQRLSDFLLLQRIRELDRQIAWYEGQIEKLTIQKEALDRYIEGLRRGEKPKLNEDGTLQDRQLEDLVRAYEKRYGTKIDRSDIGQLATVSRDTGGQITEYQGKLHEAKRERSDILREHPEAEAQAAAIEQAPREHQAEKFRQVEVEQGRDISDRALSDIENRSTKATVVGGQNFNEKSEEYAMHAADSDSVTFFADASKTDDGQVGSRKPGEMTAHFALVATPSAQGAQPQSQPDPVQDKPFTFSNTMSG